MIQKNNLYSDKAEAIAGAVVSTIPVAIACVLHIVYRLDVFSIEIIAIIYGLGVPTSSAWIYILCCKRNRAEPPKTALTASCSEWIAANIFFYPFTIYFFLKMILSEVNREKIEEPTSVTRTFKVLGLAIILGAIFCGIVCALATVY